MIAALKKDSICDGVHVMVIGSKELVPDILTAPNFDYGFNGEPPSISKNTKS